MSENSKAIELLERAIAAIAEERKENRENWAETLPPELPDFCEAELKSLLKMAKAGESVSEKASDSPSAFLICDSADDSKVLLEALRAIQACRKV